MTSLHTFAPSATTTATTNGAETDKVLIERYIDKSKLSSDINSPNNTATITFSDDDSACSFDSEEDEKLLTPPLQLSPNLNKTSLILEGKDDNEEEVINTIEELENQESEEEIDWEFWSNVISGYKTFTQSEVKNLSIQVQHGIPTALRGTIWPLLAKQQDNGLQNDYIQLLRQESVYEKAITRDLHRTFPHHPYFQSTEGQESLFNVVKAYSLYDPEVGYCQGLSFVAGPLLLNMPEEEAFCILVQLMHHYKLRGHFTPQLDLLRQRLFQFDGLLQDFLPHIHRHFLEQGVRSNMYASQWFLTLFAYKFPLDVVYRIYDTLFTEGVDCLFRIGLALLSKNQSTILALEFESLVTYLKDDMLTVYKDNITDLLSESYAIKISAKRLEKLAKDYQIELAKADTEASLIESLRKKNRILTEQHKALEAENKSNKEEYALVAEQLVSKKMELTRVLDENNALKQQATELRRVLEVIPGQIENQVQSDMNKLCIKNQDLTQKNAELQDQLADMETLIIEMKLKFAQSESDRYSLNQKLLDLKKWMNNV